MNSNIEETPARDQEFPIFTKWFGFVNWFLPFTDKLPKQQFSVKSPLAREIGAFMGLDFIVACRPPKMTYMPLFCSSFGVLFGEKRRASASNVVFLAKLSICDG